MINPLSGEPLKEFISRMDKGKRKTSKSKEHTVLLIILGLFFTGIVYTGTEMTGMAVLKQRTGIIEVSEVFTENTTLTFRANGNLTSIRITGSFTGEGEGKVMIGDLVIVDKASLSRKGDMITGMIVSENSVENFGSNSTLSQNLQEVNEAAEDDANFSLEREILDIERNESNSHDEETISEEGSFTDAFDDNNIEELDQMELERPDERALEEDAEGILEDDENALSVDINIMPDTQKDWSSEETTEEQEETQMLEEEIEELPKQELVFNFSNHCEQSCSIEWGSEFTLIIYLNNLILDITSITYTYLQEDAAPEPENLSMVDWENDPEENWEGLNLSRSVFFFDPDNPHSSLSKMGMDFIELEEDFAVAGRDRDNYLRFRLNLSNISFSFLEIEDNRISEKAIFVESEGEFQVTLASEMPSTILRCVQFDSHCRKWQKTGIAFSYVNGKAVFNISEPGIYAAGKENITKSKYVAASSVYNNRYCPGCIESANCAAKNFCPANSQNDRHFSSSGQMDFNILGISPDIEYAEICAYKFWSHDDSDTINYIQDSMTSYCAPLPDDYLPKTGAVSSLIEKGEGWRCIEITGILLYNLELGYSNMFLDWLGQDLEGGISPYNCYTGITTLERCGGNPAADDCRPYLRLMYKNEE